MSKAYADLGNSSLKIICSNFDKATYMRIDLSEKNIEERLSAYIVTHSISEILTAAVAPRKYEHFLHNMPAKISFVRKEQLFESLGLQYNGGIPGVDRMLNIRHVLRKRLFPAVVADIGSAVNVEVIDGAGTFIGGLIFPGPYMSLYALNTYAEALSGIERSALTTGACLGTSSAEAIGAGITFSISAALNSLKDLLPGQGADFKFYLTGGAYSLIKKELNFAHKYDSLFTLKGMEDL